ncbi:MAG: tail fiber domain-containing protein [Bacteroidota bacterium]
MRILKLLGLITFCFVFAYPTLDGQVSIQTESIEIERNTSTVNGFFLDIFTPIREFKVNRVGHILLRNNLSGSISDYWHFGARDNGNLDIARGLLTSNEFVSTSNALMTFDTSGNIGIGTADPTAALHIKHEPNRNGLTIEGSGTFPPVPDLNVAAWTFSIRNRDLYLFYDSDADGPNNAITHGRFNNGTLGDYISSDSKLKNNVKPIRQDALDIINQLRPVSYYYNHDKAKSKRAYGFIAQEVEAILPELILYPEEGEENAHLMLNYDDFTPFAIKGIQALSEQVEESQSEIADLKAENETLRADLAELTTLVEALFQKGNALGVSTQKAELQSSAIQQNHPNPFSETTTIEYFIADGVQQAILQITNAQGQLLQSIEIKKRGKGNLELDASPWSSGNYYYSLILDGKTMPSHQMILN